MITNSEFLILFFLTLTIFFIFLCFIFQLLFTKRENTSQKSYQRLVFNRFYYFLEGQCKGYVYFENAFNNLPQQLISSPTFFSLLKPSNRTIIEKKFIASLQNEVNIDDLKKIKSITFIHTDTQLNLSIKLSLGFVSHSNIQNRALIGSLTNFPF